MKPDFTKAEKKELAFIHVLADILKKLPDSKLQDVALNEMDKEQPALQNLARFFYLKGNYSPDQMTAIIRLCILMWWYYKDRLKVPHVKIADALFLKKKAEYDDFIKRTYGKSKAQNNYLMEENLKDHSGRFLLGYIHALIYREKSSAFMSLPSEQKVIVSINFRVMIDCFESLTDRSIVPVYLI